MAENSDSLKAPKSSFKQVHEIAQKLHIEVSYLFCKQCLQYKRMEVDPITQQNTGPIYCSIIFRKYYRDFIKIFTKKCCNNKIYSILILSDWCERLKCLINKKKPLTNEWAWIFILSKCTSASIGMFYISMNAWIFFIHFTKVWVNWFGNFNKDIHLNNSILS